MDTKLMIFDLDGTLLDTIGDLAACCDHVLAARGLPLHTYEEYCGFVGNGVMRLVERALPEELRTPETVAAVRADFVAYYTEHIDRFTRPYEGIPELLRELVQRGVRLAVASNKFQIGTEKLVRIYFPSIRFEAASVSGPEARSHPIRRWGGRFSPIRMRNPERCCTPGIRASIWIRPGQPVSGRSV